MRIIPTDTTNQITFGYHSKLMDDFRNRKIKIKKDPYGYELTKDTATHDHIIPKSKGGVSNVSNYILANVRANNKRGNEPFIKHVKLLPLLEYLATMLNVKTENVDGIEYVKKILKSMIKALKENK